MCFSAHPCLKYADFLIYESRKSDIDCEEKDISLKPFYATERGSLEDANHQRQLLICTLKMVWIDPSPSREEQQWVLDAYDRNLPP